MRRLSNRIITASHAILCAFSVVFCSIADARDEGVVEAGDIVQIVLPLSALGGTFIADDKEGRWQFAKSFGAGWLSTRALKHLVGNTRPDSGNQESFPSGHTFSAFSSAAFIDTRYGHLWGIPSYIAATFVGFSRIVADAHYTDDVIAGGSIAMFSNWAYVTPYEGPVTLTPAVFASDGVGVQVSITDAENKNADTRTYAKSAKNRYPQWRYSLGLGPAYLQKNEIKAPYDSGTTFDLNNFNNFRKIEEPVTSAIGMLEVNMDGHNELMIMAAPYESRDIGRFSTPVSFGGQTFPVDTDINSRYILYDVAGRWRYDLDPKGPWGAKLGLGISAQLVEVGLATVDKSVFSEVDDISILPYLSAELSYQFTAKLKGLVHVEGNTVSNRAMLDTGISVAYRFDEHWDASLGYTYFNRKLSSDQLINDVDYNVIIGRVGYTF